MDFSDRLTGLMEENGVTAYKLSRDTGVAQSTLSEVLNKKNKALSATNLAKIADYFEVSTDYLLGKTPFKTHKEAEHSIIIAAMKIALKNKEDFEFIKWVAEDKLLKAEYIYTSDTVNYLTQIINKLGQLELNDIEYYNLFKFIAHEISWPETFNGPTVIGIRNAEVVCDFDYFSIPKMSFNELDIKIRYLKYQSKPETQNIVKEEVALYSHESNISPIEFPSKTFRIPVLGSIPAGVAVEAVEDIIDWEEIPVEWLKGGREYFGLVVKGDSMFPEYLEGDIVIVRKQNCCDNNDDCVVMVDNTDVTLKRIKKHEDGIELEAINPMYGKKKYTNEEVNNIPITILGVVIELRRKKK
ncbi:MAG: helix-turn-helix domain-containing protein [Syntrophomonadaceae bacterium]|nr:helix-turn-helix domain-containing protein [Syntrophomonadaceae bacterium]